MLLKDILVFATGLASAVNAQHCSSYVVDSGDKELTFNNYLFEDFRNLAPASSKKSENRTEAVRNKKRALAASQSFFQKTVNLWSKQDWIRIQGKDNPVGMINQFDNVFIDYDSTYDDNSTMLSLTTKRLQNGTQVAGEFQSQFTALYGSVRFESRVTGDGGACAGLFLFESDTSESDFEFLTKEGYSNLHMTNQPGNIKGEPVKGATTNMSLDNPFTGWTTYRLDWSPGLTQYFVNGTSVVNKTVNVSNKPMNWIMNMWSNGADWTGEMKIGDSARLDIRYLQFAYNDTAKAAPAPGGLTCRLQEEMQGQGLVATIPAKRSISGYSVVARAAQVVGATVAGRAIGGALR